MTNTLKNLTNLELYDIALDDANDVSLRVEAVKLIEDEELLMSLTDFTIIDEADEKVMCEAVRRITNQEVIAKIANEEYYSEEVRSIAVCMLTDEKMLADFAMRYSNGYYDSENLGAKAVEKITNTELLKEIINDDGDDDVVCEAADKLLDLSGDYAVIERAALMSGSSNVRAYMVSLITNQAVLKDFIIKENEVDDGVKFEALEKITDDVVLNAIVFCGIGYDFEIEATRKITDQLILKDIVLSKVADIGIKVEATKKITDQLILKDIVMSKGLDIEIKEEAINQLTEQTILKDIVLNEGVELEIKVEAVKKITNASLIKEILSSGDIAVAIMLEINEDVIVDEETLESLTSSDWDDFCGDEC